MAFLDVAKLDGEELIAQYVLSFRHSGHFLPYEDYQIVQEWLKVARDPDRLLVILSEYLPPYFEKARNLPFPASLKGIHKLILQVLHSTPPV